MQKPKLLYLGEHAAGPPPGTFLIEIMSLPAHGGKDILFKKDDQQIKVFVQKCGDTVTVFENKCPHAGTPLNMLGDKFLSLDGAYIICRTHGALFEKENGKCVGGPCKGKFLQPVAFTMRKGGVYTA